MSAVLVLSILGARNLAAKDSNGLSDPYVKVKFGECRRKSRVVYKSLNPVWEDVFEFELNNQTPLTLHVSIWDEDKFSKNDFLGFITLNIDTILFDKAFKSSKWLPLLSRSASEFVSGEIHLSVKVEGNQESIQCLEKAFSMLMLTHIDSSESKGQCLDFTALENKKEVDGILFITVISATNLPELGGMTNARFDMDPFVVVSLGDSVMRTKKVRHDLNPKWNQKFELPVTAESRNWPVKFSIYDHDKFSANDFVGRTALSVSTIIDSAPEVPFVLKIDLADDAPKNCVSTLTISSSYMKFSELREYFWLDLLEEFNEPPFERISTFELCNLLDILDVSNAVEVVEQGWKELGYQLESDINLTEAHTFLEWFQKTFAEDKNISTLERCIYCGAFSFKDSTLSRRLLHMSACLQHLDSESNNFVFNFLETEEQASRNWISNLFKRVTSGSKASGEKSGTIIVVNRETGLKIEEKMPVYIRMGIRLLYQSLASSSLTSKRIRATLEKMTQRQGRKYTKPKSRKAIPNFIKFYSLNTDDVAKPIDQFLNFNEFFYRELKPGSRPLASTNPNVAVCGADCRLSVFESITEATTLWIKGHEFSLAKLLECSTDEAAAFSGGAVVIFRLAPQDYHRFHCPVDGMLESTTPVSGAYFTVNPMAVRSNLDVYATNKRTVSYIKSPQFGRVAFVAVGAMMVGSVNHTVSPGNAVRRGQELGYFAFGGSTVIVVFSSGKLVLDSDILDNSKRGFETLVRVGMSLGKRPQLSG